MQIDSIEIKNFKKISEAKINLEKITILVGGNNSGKSSVLQAIHMAVSCAQLSAELQQQVIAEANLRYSPSADFAQLGNVGPYENRKGGSRGSVEFFGKTAEEAEASYKIEIYKARNHHNVGVDRAGVSIGFGQILSDPKTLFSVYVPGLAGVPHREEMHGYATVFQKAAGGEANLVFRNILRLLGDKGLLEELESYLFDVVGPVRFRVAYDPSKDLYVSVSISHGADAPFVPIDLCGTGVMQVTQIFAYVLLFRPKLLLVDEPDSHVHPSRQSLLATAFKKIVDAFDCMMVVSTHSRHLVSAARNDAKLVWLRDGRVEAEDNNELTEILLDLGALDQLDSGGSEVIICTEDKGKRVLQNSIRSMGEEERIKIISYNGISNAASAAVIKAMADLFPNAPRVLVHRDRDFLTTEEVEEWGKDFANRGIEVFCPQLCDIESYLTDPSHVSVTYAIQKDDATEWIRGLIAEKIDIFKGKFREKRRDANQRYWKDGGAPVTAELWPDGYLPQPHQVYGKELLSLINGAAQQQWGDRRQLEAVPCAALTEELRRALEV